LTTLTKEESKVKITIKELLEVGAHFGHQKSRRNPKMAPYIYATKNGISVIDLAKTMHQIKEACAVVRKTIKAKKSVLFVGTKKQAKSIVTELADESGEFYVSQRWLGGMLTNLSTIRISVKKLEKIEKKVASNTDGYTKKELVQMTKLQGKLEKVLSGIRLMRKAPGLVIVVDPVKEHIAVAEARKLGIPVMAIVDTNANPDYIDYIIAANDDSLKSNKAILQELNNTIIDEKKIHGISLDRKQALEDERAQRLARKPAPKPVVKKEVKPTSARKTIGGPEKPGAANKSKDITATIAKASSEAALQEKEKSAAKKAKAKPKDALETKESINKPAVKKNTKDETSK
jgi:small subunit ribosomal protein S2